MDRRSPALVARCLIRRSTAERLPAPPSAARTFCPRWFAWRCFAACGSSKCRSTTEFASASRRSRAQRVPSPHVGVRMVGLILRYRLVRPVIPKLLALGGARLLALVGTQLGRPLMYDDANFALAAKAVADTGLAFGNQGWMTDRSDFS